MKAGRESQGTKAREDYLKEIGAVEYASFWRRFAASLIDGVILSIVGTILLAISRVAYENGLEAVVSIVYIIGFWVWRGQTPGKMLVGVKIFAVDGRPISLGGSILRYIGYIVSALILLIGYFMIAWDCRKQGLHDKIAGTYVVKLSR